MNNKIQLRIGAIISYISVAVNLIVGLVYIPWMVRQIGQSQYGLFTLANSLITLFLLDFGLSSAAARYVSNYHAEDDEEKIGNFLGVIYKFYIIVDAIIFIVLTVLYFFIDTIYVKLTPEELKQFKVVYIIAASFNIVNLPFVTLNGILTAYEKFIQLKLADLIYRVLVVGLTIVALLLGMGLYALVTVQVISGILVIIYKLIVIKKTTNVKVHFRYSDNNLIKEIFLFSLWTTISTLASRLIFNITPTVLGIVANSAAIAIFGVVITMEGNIYTVTTAINGMFMPTISKAYASGKDINEQLMPLMIKVGRFQFALNGLLIVGFALIGKPFIDLWVGSEYADAYYCILLVIIPGLFYNSLQIANTSMIVQNKVKLQAIIAVICGVINVILSFILSKFYGVIGASISIFIAYTIRAILYHIVQKTVMGFDIKSFILHCYLRMLPVIIVTGIIGIIVNAFIANAGWGRLLLKTVIITFTYLVAVWWLGLSRKERKSIIHKIRKDQQMNLEK